MGGKGRNSAGRGRGRRVRNVDAALQGDWGNVSRGFATAKFRVGMRIKGIAGFCNSFKIWGKMRGILCSSERCVGPNVVSG